MVCWKRRLFSGFISLIKWKLIYSGWQIRHNRFGFHTYRILTVFLEQYLSINYMQKLGDSTLVCIKYLSWVRYQSLAPSDNSIHREWNVYAEWENKRRMEIIQKWVSRSGTRVTLVIKLKVNVFSFSPCILSIFTIITNTCTLFHLTL